MVERNAANMASTTHVIEHKGERLKISIKSLLTIELDYTIGGPPVYTEVKVGVVSQHAIIAITAITAITACHHSNHSNHNNHSMPSHDATIPQHASRLCHHSMPPQQHATTPQHACL